MKYESTALAGQKETRCQIGWAETDLEFSSWFFVVVLLLWFCFHWFTSVVRPLFGPHPKMGAATFDYLRIVLANVYSRLFLVTSPCQLTFKHKLSLYFRLVSDRGHICFRWFHTSAEDLKPLGFILLIFNYRSHSLVTGWPTIST